MINAEARFNNSLRPRKPEGLLGRTAQDVHLDSHTAPELLYNNIARFIKILVHRHVVNITGVTGICHQDMELTCLSFVIINFDDVTPLHQAVGQTTKRMITTELRDVIEAASSITDKRCLPSLRVDCLPLDFCRSG